MASCNAATSTALIHQIGARLKGTPACNGWMHWRYVDARGQWQPLDTLRRKLRDSSDQK